MRIFPTGKLSFVFLVLILPGLLCFPEFSGAQTATINAATVYQTMDGWGGHTYQYADTLTGSNADLFFSTSAGIGLQIVRTSNTVDSSIPDLVSLQSAVARGAQIELGMQSPPCTWKHTYTDMGYTCSGGDTNYGPQAWRDGTVGSSGTCFADGTSIDGSGGWFDQYGSYIVSTIQNYNSHNAPITYLSVQNEADIQISSLGSCNWNSGSLFQDFIKNYLGPKLSTAGLSSVKVMLDPSYGWFGNDLVSACMNDSGCSKYVSIIGGHGYGYPYPASAYNGAPLSGQHIWLSETGEQSKSWDASIGDGLVWAKNIHDFLTIANVSGIEWWELAYSNNPADLPDGGLTDQNFNTAKRFWTEGNWSKFVRAGWVRVDATTNPQSGVYVTAFENKSSGAFAIIAVNDGGGSISQTFALNGLSASAVTPYVTDANNNLASQASIPLSSSKFTATLGGSSVTTFTTAGNAPPPPSNLTGSVIQ